MSNPKQEAGWFGTNVINPTTFSVTFSWSNNNVTVQLINGEDVLKIGDIFSDFLTNNGIPNTVTKEL